MTWLMGILNSGIGKVIFFGLDLWFKKVQKDEQMTASYYEFLRQVDRSGASKVASYMAAEDALKAKQDELRAKLDAEQAGQ